MTSLGAADAPVVERWWREFCRTGRLPAELVRVQGRLIRAVHRGALPSGPVFVKTMAFPRARDRLRYLLRPLPGAHEARLLRVAAAAGVPVPEVLAVRTARRWLLPHRSLLVLRALPVAAVPEPPPLATAAHLGLRLLEAGIEPLDLHVGNFVALADGSFAVLDLQSARCGPWVGPQRRARARVAARLLREVWPREPAGVAPVLGAGLLRSAGEAQQALAVGQRAAARWLRSRLHRCCTTSTEFVAGLRWWGREYRRREVAAVRWLPAGRRARQAWLGARALAVCEGRASALCGLRQGWWAQAGKGQLAVPAACEAAEAQAAVSAALEAYERHRAAIDG